MRTDYQFVALIFVPFSYHVKGSCHMDAWFNPPEENQGNDHIEICPLFSVETFYNLIDIWKENNL